MREMKDSGIPWVGEIPSDWNVSLLLEHFHEIKNLNKGLVEQNLLSLSYGNIVRKDITSNDGLLPASFEIYNVIPVNSIVLRLTDLQNDKRSLRSAISNERGIITSAYTTISVNSESRDSPKYMNYLCRCYDLCKVFYNIGSGVRQSINYTELKRMPILVPPTDIQRRIADYLDKKCAQIDSIIAKEQSVIDKLQEYKRSAITEAVTKGLDPDVEMKDSGVEWLTQYPIGWKLSKIKYIAEFNPKYDYRDIPDDTEITYTPMEYIKNGNFIQNTSKRSALSSSLTKYVEGDIVMAKVTPCFENGNIAVMENLVNFKGMGSSELFVLKTSDIYRKFLFYWLQNRYFVEACVATMTGTGGLKRISSYFVTNSEIFIPPFSELERIVEYIDEKCEAINKVVDSKQSLITKLTEYKQSLIYEVVTGKKEVSHV